MLKKASTLASLCLCLISAAPAWSQNGGLTPGIDVHPLPITTSWLGNTLLRGRAWGPDTEPSAQRWMMDYMSAMCVSPDGYVFGTTTYEEGIQRTGVYHNGDNVLDRPDGGSPEGTAVAATDHYLALGLGDGQTVRLYKRLPGKALDGQSGNGAGDKTDIAVSDKKGYISGLAVDEARDRLYVSFAALDLVKVFTLEGASVSQFDIFDGRLHAAGPDAGGKMALDGAGNLWIAEGYGTGGMTKIAGTLSSSAPAGPKDTPLDAITIPNPQAYFVSSDKDGFVTQDLGGLHHVTNVHFKGDENWTGAKLQGAANAAGPWTDLCTFTRPVHQWPDEWLTVDDPGSYRYVRFLAAPGQMLSLGQFDVYESAPPHDGRILCYGSDGTKLPQEIAVAEPAALGWDAKDSRLLAADNGPNQQICAYVDVDSQPHLDPTFGSAGKLGQRGGIFAGTPQDAGKIGPGRLDNIRGVGADDTGKVYIAMAGGDGVSQTRLECYSPEGSRVWAMAGLSFEDQAALDPASETDVYSAIHHYRMDYSMPAGNEWSLVGVTDDQRKYNWLDRSSGTAAGLRRIGGHLYLLVQGDRQGSANWFRFDPAAHGEIAIPMSMLRPMNTADSWPPNQPPGLGRFLWNDLNGDTEFQINEFEKTDDYLVGPASYDADANLWFYGFTVTPHEIHKLAVSAPDSHGNLAWHWSNPQNQTFATPEPFASSDPNKPVITSVDFDSATSSLYVTGFTKDHPFTQALGRNNTFGPVLVRYAVAGGTLRPLATVFLPADVNIGCGDHDIPYSISLAGDYVFIGYWNSMEVRIYRKNDLGFVGQYLLGEQTAIPILDGTAAIRAYKRSKANEYLIFESNYVGNAIIMVRWKPDVTNAPSAPLQLRAPAATITGSSVNLSWVPSASAEGYKVERMILTKNGWSDWEEIARPSDPKFTDTALRPAHTYAYRVRAFNRVDGGGNSDYSRSVYIDTPAQ